MDNGPELDGPDKAPIRWPQLCQPFHIELLDGVEDGARVIQYLQITPAILKAIRVVLPKTTRCLPVGGITPDTMKAYVDAGASGFGLGSALYKPGMSDTQVVAAATAYVAAWQGLTGG